MLPMHVVSISRCDITYLRLRVSTFHNLRQSNTDDLIRLDSTLMRGYQTRTQKPVNYQSNNGPSTGFSNAASIRFRILFVAQSINSSLNDIHGVISLCKRANQNVSQMTVRATCSAKQTTFLTHAMNMLWNMGLLQSHPSMLHQHCLDLCIKVNSTCVIRHTPGVASAKSKNS